MPTTPFLRFAARAVSALLASTAFASAAAAAPRSLSDTEMSAVRGADGSILASLQPASKESAAPSRSSLANDLATAFSSSTGATFLAPDEFATVLESTGLSAAMVPGYAGQPVAQTRVDAGPVTFSFGMASVLQTVGVTYAGPSMGTFTMTRFDARGTTIWMWQHP
jgi:hypothetical protein